MGAFCVGTFYDGSPFQMRFERLVRISTMQNQYSLANRTFEKGLYEICLKENIWLLAYSPLSGGVLTGKYLDGARPEGTRFTLFTRNSPRYNGPHVQAAVKRYVELARSANLNPGNNTSRLPRTKTVHDQCHYRNDSDGTSKDRCRGGRCHSFARDTEGHRGDIYRDTRSAIVMRLF